MNDNLKKQIDFIIEIDKIKSIFRKTRLFDKSRYENDAEHSWHFTVMALILSGHSNEKIDTSKVIKMALIHDIVEIDAGDTLVYHIKDNDEKIKKETEAAERIFGLLPAEQKNEMTAIWKEFEERKTPEAKFAAALDRLEPVLQNYLDNGKTWKDNNIKYEKIIQVNEKIKDGSKELWEYAFNLINECIKK